MISKNDFQKAVDLINKSGNILITTHTRPDGDACGAIAAIYDVLTALDKKVKRVFLSEIPEWYEFLFVEKTPIPGSDITVQQLKESKDTQHDLIIIVDTNSNNQLPEFAEYLKQNDKPVLVVDHHVTSDSLGDVELIDSTAAAASLIVFDLIKYANWQITPKIARALFVGAATDTGWFQFNNTDSRVHRACAELIEAGVKPTEIYHRLYQNVSLGRLKLMAVMLGTLELHLNGRYATQHLRQCDFEQAGAKYNDTENLIDECQRIGTVEAAALFIELKDGRVKCSLRSTGALDVRKIAQKLGGGGHTLAAGVHLSGPLESARQLIFDAVAEQFAQIEGS